MSARTAPAWIAVGFLFVAAMGVVLGPLLPVDETRYLAVAWEMWLSGDYLVPTKNFALYTHKPPLLFWLINAVWSFTGVSEIAARLVAPVGAALGVWLTARLATRLWPGDPGIGTRAALALSGSIAFAVAGGLTMFDTLLALTVVAAMTALVPAARTGSYRWWALAGVAIGAGVLAKGPVVLVHVLPAMIAVPFWAGQESAWGARALALRIGVALLTALACVSLWLVPAIVSGGPEYRDAVLWTQSAGRVSDSFAHARPWWFYAALLPLLLFPWVLIPAIWRAGAKVRWREPGLRLAAVWGVCALVLFSFISGKQVHYLIPELPAAALVVARLTRDLSFRPILPALALIAVAVAAIAASAGGIAMGEVERLLHPASMLLAFAFLLLAVCWTALQTGRLAGGAVLGLGAVLSTNLLIGLTDTARAYDTHAVSRLIVPYEDGGIATYGQVYHAEFNFAGRLREPVATPANAAALDVWMAAHPEGVIVSRPDRDSPPWSPRETALFRNATYGIWHVEDARSSDTEVSS